MSATKYIQISQYALLEYQYDTDTINTNNANFFSVYDKKLNRFYLKNDDTVSSTNNVINKSSVKIEDSLWADLNRNYPVPYINKDDNLVFRDYRNDVYDFEEENLVSPNLTLDVNVGE